MARHGVVALVTPKPRTIATPLSPGACLASALSTTLLSVLLPQVTPKPRRREELLFFGGLLDRQV